MMTSTQVYRDVAQRYIQRFGGRTERQTDFVSGDEDYDVHLISLNGQTLGAVLSNDKYPERKNGHSLDDMPF